MLDRLILIAALTANALPAPPAASPSPSPAPGATPELKTIASVRATSRCAAIITHANGAIDKTLNNDRVITQTISALRMTDLDDGNPIHRRNGLNNLGDLAKTLMLQARSGDDEVKRLREIAAKTQDPQDAKALKAFADQLGGALWRQQKIARDLNGYLAYVDFHDMTQWSEADQQMNTAVFGVADPLAENPVDFQGRGQERGSVPAPHPHLGHDPNDPTATDYARQAADDFEKRIPDIVIDENHAASNVDSALGKC